MTAPLPSARTRTAQLAIWFGALAAASTFLVTRPIPSASVEATGPETTEVADDGARRRLAWIVQDLSPVIFGSTEECIGAGAGCGADPMLDTDTTALRAGALSSALTDAITSTGPGYVGDVGDDLRALAADTATATAALASQLRTWLDSGCGSNIGGIPADVHPAECADRSAIVREHLGEVAQLLGRWPAP